MKAMVQSRYGPPDVLALEEIEQPPIGEEEVLIRVRAAGVSYPDGVISAGVPYVLRLFAGLRRPRYGVRGTEVSGTVAEAGAKVTDLRPGDEVFGWCGRFEQAASLPVSGVTALQAVRDWGRVRPGQLVLINGASGGVGTFAVQIAKAFGAEVTGVCGTGNVGLVRSIGADAVIDYTKEDFTRGTRRYDVIIDVPHFATHSLADCRHVLAPGGTLVLSSNTRNRWIGGFSRVIPARVMAPFMSQRVCAPEMAQDQADLIALAELAGSGKVTPVIARTYLLAEVPAAIRNLQEGHTRGKLIIAVIQ